MGLEIYPLTMLKVASTYIPDTERDIKCTIAPPLPKVSHTKGIDHTSSRLIDKAYATYNTLCIHNYTE